MDRQKFVFVLLDVSVWTVIVARDRLFCGLLSRPYRAGGMRSSLSRCFLRHVFFLLSPHLFAVRPAIDRKNDSKRERDSTNFSFISERSAARGVTSEPVKCQISLLPRVSS